MNIIELSGCVIIANGKLLVLWKNEHGHYELPGGKVKEGETLEEAAIRETKEEIGCDVELLKYAGYIDFSIKGKNCRSHNYLAKIKEGQTPRIMEPKSFKDLIWLPIENYEEYTVAPNVKKICEDYLSGKF
ncbi:TPA: NUDIX hydrolase [archaeon]|uniref:NUDIX hydrolase n=1 Tax=Candidatus Naiadarchaeum limnaeum TaxID=2756139 RepID=A0A832X5V0_9ARCH|nr:NUDIX hydrolase [Candidatus Naiadarchaeales archaeon SRR2090153.bin1042]HIK00170.1 NUDIX hydrolase [Candidatus Naiadarchaeum limnaeum]